MKKDTKSLTDIIEKIQIPKDRIVPTLRLDLTEFTSIDEREDKIYDFSFLKIDDDYLLGILCKSEIHFYILDSKTNNMHKLKKKGIILEVIKMISISVINIIEFK